MEAETTSATTTAAAGRRESLTASPPMFENPILDRLSRVHPAVPPALYIPVILALLWLSRPAGLLSGIVLFAGGYLTWTLVEYWGHRVLFHYEPEEGIGARIHWLIHGVHHDHPNDPLRLVMPPLMSVPIMLLAYVIGSLLVPAPAGYAMLAGFIAGYLAYDMVHYAVHHFRPRTRLGRRLRQLHMVHHFQDDTRSFGVSAPWWDKVFRTAPHRPRRDG